MTHQPITPIKPEDEPRPTEQPHDEAPDINEQYVHKMGKGGSNSATVAVYAALATSIQLVNVSSILISSILERGLAINDNYNRFRADLQFIIPANDKDINASVNNLQVQSGQSSIDGIVQNASQMNNQLMPILNTYGQANTASVARLQSILEALIKNTSDSVNQSFKSR